MINVENKKVWNIVAWYCSWYCPLKSKLFLSKKLRWRFYIVSSSLSRRLIQIRQHFSPIDLSALQFLYSPLLQNVGIICPNNTFRCIYSLSSVDHTTSLTCFYWNALDIFYQVVIQKIWSSYFFKDKIITSGLTFVLPVIQWSSNKCEFRMLYVKCFDGWRCFKYQCMISNFPFNFFGDLFLTLLWSTMWFIDFVYSKPQLSIRDSFRSGGDNLLLMVIPSGLSVFLSFLKNSEETALWSFR